MNAPVEPTLKELHAYAKLLFLRTGRQFEDKTLYEELEGEIWPHELADDGHSAKNSLLESLDVNLLRRKFLDKLSETVSSTKGGRYVVASYMFYWPDKVKVFVAINSGFSEGDTEYKFLEKLCTSLKEVAAAPDNQTERHTDALWAMLLYHQHSRINTTIAELQQTMKKFPDLFPQHLWAGSTNDNALPDTDGVALDFNDCLDYLATLIFGSRSSDLETHDTLVSLSHAIYRVFPVERFDALGPAGPKLHQEIGFLGRLKSSFRIIAEAARQISGFDDLSLIPVVRPKPLKKRPSQDWNLVTTFHALNLALNNVSVKNLMGSSASKPEWTEEGLLKEFSALKSPTWQVHAEIQLIDFILRDPDEIANGKAFDYIGCSRYSCLLCSKFLLFFSDIKTRGCHGKLYNHSWTIPLADNLVNDGRQMIWNATKKLVLWMREDLIGSSLIGSTRRKPEVKESTAFEYLRRQRAQNFNAKPLEESLSDLVEDEEGWTDQTQYVILEERKVDYCTTCIENETDRRCSYCQGANFCSQACERRMPLSHLIMCSMRQVTPADYLYEDVLENSLPTDPQTRQDYWFDRCQNKSEEQCLFGLFLGLLKYHPYRISREDLHRWRSDPDGNPYLVAKIEEKFEELPINNRGGYFPWFLGHRDRFELPDSHHSIPRAPGPMVQAQDMQAKARKYLAREDQHKAVEDLTPFAKMHCFLFYSLMLDHMYPPATDFKYSYWFDFGFVISHNKDEEETLASMYITMLFGPMHQEEYARILGYSTMPTQMNKGDPTCSFEEFWKAWEKGKLMTIFDKCWPESPDGRPFFLIDEYNLVDRLRVFFESETPRPSIWKLRHFLAMEDTSVESVEPEIAQAARDYGFSEKLDTRTTIELRGFYKELLQKTDPLVIHQERMKGNLVQFAQDYIVVSNPRVKEALNRLL